jgi:tRNA (cmo5U34)-methyltransferase
MSDNTTPHPARSYDQNIQITIPYYNRIQEEILEFIDTLEEKPVTWLDTGCGTGTLVFHALKRFPETDFTLVDPSAEMLVQVRAKCSGSRVRILNPCCTELLDTGDQYDLITAIQCHHYLDNATRKLAVERCFSLLKPGGVFITSENIRPSSRDGVSIGLRYWGRFMEKSGKTREEITAHMLRFDTEYHPLTIAEHHELYHTVGFPVVELLWYSYLQGVFYAMKPGLSG